MILNNLQKTKKKINLEIQRQRKGLMKNLNTCTNISKALTVYTKYQIRQFSKKCKISKAMDSMEDDLFQMDSFDNSHNYFEDYSPKKV